MITQSIFLPEGQRVLLIGNWSYRNLGDELILAGTITLLQQQKKTILIQAYDPTRLREWLSKLVDTSDIIFLTEIPKGFRSWIKRFRGKKWKELAQYGQISSFILGGGEILTEENPNSYWYWLVSLLPLLVQMVFRKIPGYLMGGVQVPKKAGNKLLFSFLMNCIRKARLRDQESVDALKKRGFAHAEFFMDTSYFAWDRKQTRDASKTENTQKQKHIIINLNYNGKQFFDELLQDLLPYTNRGYRFSYIPVAQGGTSHYQDLSYLPELQKNLPTQEIHILDRQGDREMFVRELASAEKVFSARLHLFLISRFLGVETKVYPYQKKILKMEHTILSVLGEA